MPPAADVRVEAGRDHRGSVVDPVVATQGAQVPQTGVDLDGFQVSP
jgi:hypothetical protein